VKSDSKTFSSVLPACASIATLEQGMEIHGEIIRSGFQTDVSVGSALVDMHAKCGNIDKARALFDRMTSRNAVSWTSMIATYAMHGFGREALKVFEQMQNSGINPDHVTLLCVLTACCHAGLIDEGQQYFDCMRKILSCNTYNGALWLHG
jgi:pentatricopeptide repeat protein